MHILQVKKTNIAQAPDELAAAICRYSSHTSTVAGLDNLPPGDVVHFHNQYVPLQGPQLIQYHSEPFRVNLAYPHLKTVISQYHATLPEYRECRVVRNVINFEDPLYDFREVRRLRVAYSPSNLFQRTGWANKGFHETYAVLERLRKRLGFEVDYIISVPLEECIARKSRCNVIIDECMTGSFHRSGLEGLALGKLTICHLSEAVSRVLLCASGAERIPFRNSAIGGLESCLVELHERGGDYILEEGRMARQWMEKWWHPKDIVSDFVGIYEGLS